MNPYVGYRCDVNDAVKFFRPVLKSLHIREPKRQDMVFLAQFDHLDLLNLDNCVVTVLRAKLIHTDGMFFCRKKNDIIHCYIVIKDELYKNEIETVKFIGVHEFTHFMAIIFSLTSTSIPQHRNTIAERLQDKVDELSIESLNAFYSVLDSNDNISGIPEMDDTHYRLQCEGETIDYGILFLNFLFSKELFEEYFTEIEQSNFRGLLKEGNKQSAQEALELFQKCIKKAETEKSVNHKIAFKQALSWVKNYIE